MNETPLLWFLNRSTGITLTLVLSASVALGVLTLQGRAAGDGGARLPRFVTQSLHRNLAVGGLALLVVHVVTAVADGYVDIRWWHALVPWGGYYEPFWLALGTLAFDLMIAVAITTALRGRIPHRAWRAVHVASWGAWLAGVVHGIGIGTDLKDPDRWAAWAVVPTGLSIAVVAAALVLRLTVQRRLTDARRPVVRVVPAGATRPGATDTLEIPAVPAARRDGSPR